MSKSIFLDENMAISDQNFGLPRKSFSTKRTNQVTKFDGNFISE